MSRRPVTLLLTLALLPALLAQAPAPAARSKKERLLDLYRNEARGYTIYRDASRREKVELKPDPVYVWTNPTRNVAQDGAVFVWTCRGRSEAVGTFFSYPPTGPRSLNHELQSLALSTLDVTRPGANTWTPEAEGVTPVPTPGAPAPARSAPQRLAQMRTLTRDFSATTEDRDGKRWELRILPQPLYRYESTDPDVVDGGLFAFVTTAGTDPEAFLVLEARRPARGGEPIWHHAVTRFTDMALVIRHQGREIFSGPILPWDQPRQEEKHRYRSFRDRGIPPIEDDAADGAAAEPTRTIRP